MDELTHHRSAPRAAQPFANPWETESAPNSTAPLALQAQRQGMEWLYTAQQAAEFDQYAHTALGFPPHVLMALAGRAIAARVQRILARQFTPQTPVYVVTGAGNNGGDGWVAALALWSQGVRCHVLATAPRAQLRGAAAAAADNAYACAPLWGAADAILELPRPPAWMAQGVIVDALLGTGARAPLTPQIVAWINWINTRDEQGCSFRLAVDVPSGQCATTGASLGAMVQADETLTMIVHKRGVPVPVRLAPLDIPRAALPPSAALRITLAYVRNALPKPNAQTHKGLRGHVTVVGGCPAMPGAARLATQSAQRVGAGLCTWLAVGAQTAPHAPDVTMVYPWLPAPSQLAQEQTRGATAVAIPTELDAIVNRRGAVLLGPGLGRDRMAKAAALAIITAAPTAQPLVVDADALYWVATDATVAGALHTRQSHGGQTILTPHTGEAARLLGTHAALLSSDRFAAAQRLATQYQAIVVAKGPQTLIAAPCGTVAMCPIGGEELSTGGTGDVLAGAIAGFAAQGLAPFAAAACAVWLHASAGNQQRKKYGRRGLLASDLPNALARALAVHAP